ncbi:MAG: XF1762 family protein [Eubacteriales bacterium]
MEVTRLCTLGGRNVCSFLCCCRPDCKGDGYRKIITYTLDTENGASIRAAGGLALALPVGSIGQGRAGPKFPRHRSK